MGSGVIVGVVVAVLGLGIASLSTGPVELTPPGGAPALPEGAAEVPATPEPEAAVPEAGPEAAPDAALPPIVEPEPVPELVVPEEPEAALPGLEAMPEGVTAEEPAAGDAADAVAEPEPAEAAPVEEPETAEAPGVAEPVVEPEATEPEAAPEAEPVEPAPETSAVVPETVPSAVVPEMMPETAPGTMPEDAPAEAVAEPVPVPDAAPAETDPAAGVVTGRLPSIGTPAATAPEAEAAMQPAIERNAEPFEAVADRPLLALLLLDTGERSALPNLANLPFPISVAVDASAPDAAEAIEFYRNAGIEVVISLPLPEGATPTDVDVTFEAYAPLFERAVAVLVDEPSGFQTLGDGAVQVGVNALEDGLGLVSFPAGLNTGFKAVEKEGVPSGLVFRDLDGAGQDGAVIRRFLDNAAFRARNEDRVIVLARTRPETLQALVEWSLGTRAQSVSLAPLSAVLLSQ